MWLGRSTRSIRLLQTDRTCGRIERVKIVCGTNVDLHMRRTKLLNEKFV